MENLDLAIVSELQKQHHTLKQMLSCLMVLAGEKHPDSRAEHAEPVPEEKLFNRNEAAAFLLVHPRTVTRYRTSGRLRFVHNADSRIRYREEDLKDCYFWKWDKRP
ncbi:helix-turn-helix domain-containing protein [Parapedobacter deserti]|uniref:Helix-turn-helix domain-containing protein n=1 Tax=Parapedobacter deserti TaxID=1912957 RepID=A0ABV7JN75_9SPHI